MSKEKGRVPLLNVKRHMCCPMKGLKMALIEFKNVSAEISLSNGFPFPASLLLRREIWVVDEVRIEGKGLFFFIPIYAVEFLKLID